MKIILFGGSGLIGKAVGTSLHQNQNEIIILTRSPQKYTSSPQYHYEYWDGKTTQILNTGSMENTWLLI
jgi:NAD dependent epimerase/dehydratase family enzyme